MSKPENVSQWAWDEARPWAVEWYGDDQPRSLTFIKIRTLVARSLDAAHAAGKAEQREAESKLLWPLAQKIGVKAGELYTHIDVIDAAIAGLSVLAEARETLNNVIALDPEDELPDSDLSASCQLVVQRIDEAAAIRGTDKSHHSLGSGSLCGDCPPEGYPTDKTRCTPCPRRSIRDAFLMRSAISKQNRAE